MRPMGGETGLGSNALHTGLWVWLRSPTLLHAVHLGAAEQQAARGEGPRTPTERYPSCESAKMGLFTFTGIRGD